MKTIIKISFLIIAISLLIRCQNSERSKPKLSVEYGKEKNQNDSLGVELRLNSFKNFRELVSRTNKIVCNDSLPKITLTSEKKLKTIYFQNPCWENYGCILIKQKNTIEIHNDTISKAWETYYSIDSLENVLRRDIENYGKNPMLADNPKKLLIYLSYDFKGLERLPKTLDLIIESYSKITNSTDINIWLQEKHEIPPPPPPINGIENEMEIELDE